MPGGMSPCENPYMKLLACFVANGLRGYVGNRSKVFYFSTKHSWPLPDDFPKPEFGPKAQRRLAEVLGKTDYFTFERGGRVPCMNYGRCSTLTMDARFARKLLRQDAWDGVVFTGKSLQPAQTFRRIRCDKLLPALRHEQSDYGAEVIAVFNYLMTAFPISLAAGASKSAHRNEVIAGKKPSRLVRHWRVSDDAKVDQHGWLDSADGLLYGRLTDQAGRQGYSKADRDHIIIAGERTVEVDLRACLLSIAIVAAGHELPATDPYELIGLESASNAPRDAIKTVVTRALGASHEGKARYAIKAALKKLRIRYAEIVIADTLAAIGRLWPSVRANLFNGEAANLQRTESDILIVVLNDMGCEGIPGLPIHDGLRVRECDAKLICELYAEAWRTVTGSTLPEGYIR